MGCVIEGSDPQVYADRLGYPLPLVAILDTLINDGAGTDLASAGEYALAWLERTPVGADLSGLVGNIVLFILADTVFVDESSASALMEKQRKAVMQLHQHALAGEEISRNEWKGVRKAAVAITDAHQDDRFLRPVGLTIEAVAWPATERNVLADALRARGRLDINLALQEIAWTDSDERRVNTIMEAAEGRQTQLKGMERVFAIIEAEDPTFAERVRRRVAQHAKFGVSTRKIAQFVLETLAAAPMHSHEPSLTSKRA
jgi:hypothetical protein